MNTDSINNPILIQSEEHKLIFNYVSRIDNMLVNNNVEELTALVVGISRMMEKDLETHFLREEKVFFPALLVGRPSWEHTQVVTELISEHCSLRREMSTVVELVQEKLKHSSRVDEHLVQQIKPLIVSLKEHARKEIVDVFPVISEVKECTRLVSDYFNKVDV